MKVSSARLERAVQVRDAALRVLRHTGYDFTIADTEKGYCHRTRKAKVDGLIIMWSRPGHQQLIDIWVDKKVFSIRWNDAETPSLIAFRPGDWEAILMRFDISQILESVECSTELRKWLIY